MMNIEHLRDGDDGAFVIRNTESGAPVLAEMTYSLQGEHRMVISHTGVRPALQGRGVARKLLNAAVEYARDHDLKIVPVCSYVQRVFDKSEDYEDVIAS